VFWSQKSELGRTPQKHRQLKKLSILGESLMKKGNKSS